MVKIEVARAAVEQLVSKNSLVAVFTGATTGIGGFTLRGLARTASKYHGGRGLSVYLVGRNVAAADKILDDCRKLCPEGVFQFVKASNLALLQDIDNVCDEIKRLEEAKVRGSGGPARVDMLIMTQGILHFGPRDGQSVLYHEPTIGLTFRFRN
jgi:NAD(P)-dependent dehydrogenase (short-subunit alcohol dehydrogenase family)